MAELDVGPLIMKFLLSIAVLLITTTVHFAADITREVPYHVENSSDDIRIKEIRASMDDVHFDSLDFSTLNFIEAIELLRNRAYTSQRGFSSIVASTPQTPFPTNPLKLVLSDVSLPEAVDAICNAIDFYWSCRGKIYISPQNMINTAQQGAAANP